MAAISALLYVIGPRIDLPRRRRAWRPRRLWTRWARFVISHRLAAAAAGLAILAALGAAGAGIRVGAPQSTALAQSGPAYQGLLALRAGGISTGVFTPVEVLVPGPGNLASLRARLDALPGVYGVGTPAGPAWRRDGTAVATRSLHWSQQYLRVPGRLRSTKTQVQGAPAQMPRRLMPWAAIWLASAPGSRAASAS